MALNIYVCIFKDMTKLIINQRRKHSRIIKLNKSIKY